MKRLLWLKDLEDLQEFKENQKKKKNLKTKKFRKVLQRKRMKNTSPGLTARRE